MLEKFLLFTIFSSILFLTLFATETTISAPVEGEKLGKLGGIFSLWEQMNGILESKGQALVHNMTISWDSSNQRIEEGIETLHSLWNQTNGIMGTSVDSFNENFAQTMNAWKDEFKEQAQDMLAEMKVQGNQLQENWKLSNAIMQQHLEIMENLIQVSTSRVIDTTNVVVQNTSLLVESVSAKMMGTIDQSMVRLSNEMKEGTLAFQKTSLLVFSNVTDLLYRKSNDITNQVVGGTLGVGFLVFVCWYLQHHQFRDHIFLLASLTLSIFCLTPAFNAFIIHLITIIQSASSSTPPTPTPQYNLLIFKLLIQCWLLLLSLSMLLKSLHFLYLDYFGLVYKWPIVAIEEDEKRPLMEQVMSTSSAPTQSLVANPLAYSSALLDSRDACVIVASEKHRMVLKRLHIFNCFMLSLLCVYSVLGIGLVALVTK